MIDEKGGSEGKKGAGVSQCWIERGCYVQTVGLGVSVSGVEGGVGLYRSRTDAQAIVQQSSACNGIYFFLLYGNSVEGSQKRAPRARFVCGKSSGQL